MMSYTAPKSMFMTFYIASEHKNYIKDWLVARDLKGEDNLPETGYVALKENMPVAAGFIRIIEGGYGQVDSVVTNPLESPEVRDEALDLITNQLVSAAKLMKLKGLIANITDKNTLMRSIRHGFMEVPHKIMTLDLSNEANKCLS